MALKDLLISDQSASKPALPVRRKLGVNGSTMPHKILRADDPACRLLGRVHNFEQKVQAAWAVSM